MNLLLLYGLSSVRNPPSQDDEISKGGSRMWGHWSYKISLGSVRLRTFSDITLSFQKLKVKAGLKLFKTWHLRLRQLWAIIFLIKGPVLVLRYVHIHATDVSVMAGTDVSVLSDICIRDPWGKITDASVILVFRIRLSWSLILLRMHP